MPTPVAPPPELVEKAISHIFTRATPQLYEKISDVGSPLLKSLLKSDKTPAFGSNQGANTGIREHPFDMSLVAGFQIANEHHSTCIHTKVASTVGLGFLNEQERKQRIAASENFDGVPTAQPGTKPKKAKDLAKAVSDAMTAWKISKVDEILNPLCHHSWQDTICSVAEDFWEQGNGYIEVVRESPSNTAEIVGLNLLPAPTCWLFVENDRGNNIHYRVNNGEGLGSEKYFAEFGDLEDFLSRETSPVKNWTPEQKKQVSEVIHIRRPTSKHRWYGFPDWLSAVAAIELIRCLRQYKYDFFNNRGVPEFLLLFLGMKLEPADWKKVEGIIDANIGRGNSHKSAALNLAVPDNFKVEMIKMTAEGKTEESLDKVNESYQTSIVTGHGVPPLLAGILIPGKLGASNELPNAIRAFQLLRVGPAQRVFQMKLGSTLGEKALNGGLQLNTEDFTLRTLLDEINLDQMDTSTRMRQTEQQAAAEGRDLGAGVKD